MHTSARRLSALLLITFITSIKAARTDPGATIASTGTANADPALTSADQLELTNATLAARLAEVASPEKCIMFTTTSAYLPALLNMTRNWFMHVHKVGRGGNTMIISQDAGTCASLLAMGIPCYLDKLSPQAWQLPEGARYKERPFDFGKIWWAHRFAQLGYSSMYMDNDVVLQKDPISAEFLQTSYDIQGLSDFRGPRLPTLGGIADTEGCPLYVLKKDETVPGGDVFHPSFQLVAEDVTLRAMSPCQSLGTFYVAPTPAAMSFLAALQHWIMYTHPQQWDQAAWNELIMGYVVGMGAEEPLRYRLLPVDRFMNIEVWEKRKKLKLPLQPVLLHAGFLADAAKSAKLREHNMWAADQWKPYMAPSTVTKTKRRSGFISRLWLLIVPILAAIGLVAWLLSPGKSVEVRHSEARRGIRRV